MPVVKPIDNHDIAEIAEVVFANSSSYYVESPMVGREDETAVVLDALAAEGVRRTVSLSAPLGAGKTFFLNTVIGQHHRNNPEFDSRSNCRFVLATSVTPPSRGIEGPDHIGLDATPERAHAGEINDPIGLEALFSDVDGRQVLVVEELDRKATLGQIRWTVAASFAWLARKPNRVESLRAT